MVILFSLTQKHSLTVIFLLVVFCQSNLKIS